MEIAIRCSVCPGPFGDEGPFAFLGRSPALAGLFIGRLLSVVQSDRSSESSSPATISVATLLTADISFPTILPSNHPAPLRGTGWEMEVTEQEMREAEVPSPKSQKELLAYIESLVNREHDYGTCVYAMSMSAVATFNYVAGMLGVTGFQASCADLDILRRTRSLKGPFSIQRGEDWLYPQYDPEERLRKFRVEISEWLSAEAKQLLKERDSAHPNVVAHWQKLAGA